MAGFLNFLYGLFVAVGVVCGAVIAILLLLHWRRDPAEFGKEMRWSFRSRWNAYTRFEAQSLALLVVVGIPLLVAFTWKPHFDLGIAVIGVLLLAFWCACLLLALRARRPLEQCSVVIMHIVVPSEPDYYIAQCDSCGWLGVARDNLDAAFRDGRRHAPRVKKRVLERPIEPVPG